jgi:hypothetical protein
MKIILISIAFFVCFSPTPNGSEAEIKSIKRFVNTLVNKNYSAESVIKNCSPQTYNGTDDKALQSKKFLKDALHHLREELITKDLSKLKFTNIKDLPEAKEHYTFTDREEVYVITFNNEVIMRVLMSGETIKSFIAMNKGGQHIFLLFP